jgi:glutathione-specific gamma-glutamylcyclotransferase
MQISPAGLSLVCQQRSTESESESERVWGAAYHIIPSKVKTVKAILDIREINGYSVQYTTFHSARPHSKEIRCLVYIGMPDNPQFLGVLHPQDVAERINRSVGPSGENRDYLLHLERSLEELNAESADAHISDLAMRVRGMEPQLSRPQLEVSKNMDLHRVSSTDEQEEIEKEP